MAASVKSVLDPFFSGYNFDTAMYKKIVMNNVEFITKGDNKTLFGSRLVGNHIVSYTMYDKNIFYSNLFDLTAEEIIEEIDKITTIPKHFKVARDDVNLMCFYIAHRFMSNKDLPEAKRIEYATEILNYFSYRTLVLICSRYFKYPISDDKAVSLSERLSNKYIIKRVKNWNEYCVYRSEEYISSRFSKLLISFNKDSDIPNAIIDLFNATKKALKNIYAEMIDMLENDEILKSNSSARTDIEGKEVIVDKIGSVDSYLIKIESAMTDKNTFIKQPIVGLTVDIINSVPYTQMYETLDMLLGFTHKDKKSRDEANHFIKEVLVSTIEYLHKNEIYLHKNTNVLQAVNSVVGNILYARGTDLKVNQVKENGIVLLKKIYKSNNKKINDRSLSNLRNALFVYIVLFMLIE